MYPEVFTDKNILLEKRNSMKTNYGKKFTITLPQKKKTFIHTQISKVTPRNSKELKKYQIISKLTRTQTPCHSSKQII